MKKETKRYSIVEYVGKTIRTVNTEKEYDALIDYIKKVNSRKTSKFYFGNISKKEVDGKIELTIHIYNRLTQPRTIRDIDEECRGYVSIKDMLESGYRAGTMHYNPDIYISYFETKNESEKNDKDVDIRIKPLPLLFECDQKYFDESYIKKCLDSHSSKYDFQFFLDLVKDFRYDRSVYERANELLEDINSVKRNDINSYHLSHDAIRFYNTYIIERDNRGTALRDDNGNFEKSHRRIRDFASFVREREMITTKRLSATHYNVKQDPRNMNSKPDVEETEVKFLR